MKFKEWLNDQRHRNDAVGALAQATKDVSQVPLARGRQQDEHKKWAEFLTRNGTWRHVVAFNDAWQEFLLAKEAAGESG